MRIRNAILIVALLASSACTNSGDSAGPPQSLLPTSPANSSQTTSASEPANSQSTSLPPDVALPPAPPILPPSTQPVSLDDAVATFNNNAITYRELLPILLSANGFNAMLLVFERDLALQEAARSKVTVTPDDIANEMKITMNDLQKSTSEMNANGQPANAQVNDLNLTPEQLDQLLEKALEQKHVSRAEFDVYIETNAILRKIDEPTVQARMTDSALRVQFNADYGEKVQVECIVLQNNVDVQKARLALKNGESFESVARRMSIDHASAEVGGKLEPFTVRDNRYPEPFKQMAFVLNIGDVSDTFQIGEDVRNMQGGFWILKLIDRIPPAIVKFEDYKEAVREELHKTLMDHTINAQQQRLQQFAGQLLKVQDPILKKIWDEKTKPPGTSDPNKIRQQMDSQHAPATIPAPPASATMPAIAPVAQ